MSDLKSGMFVQHASLGLGKVVAVEPDAVHVFFDASQSRFATKLRLPMAAPFLSATTAKNAWLAATAPFERDERGGRYALAQTWIGQREAVARFSESFPDGFAEAEADAAATRCETARTQKWRSASAAYSQLLGGGNGERLLDDGKLQELVRRALRVEKHVSVLSPAPDKGALTQALADPDACREFFAAVFALVAAPLAERRSRFEHLARAAAELPRASPGAPWIVVTVLPAIAQPERHVFVRPRATCDAAHRLGLDVKFDPEPNWRTYDAVLGASKLLLETLRPLGARDYFDVDSFVHETGRRAKSGTSSEAVA